MMVARSLAALKRLRPYAWPCGILVSAAAMAACQSLAPGQPARLVVTLWFLSACPGMAFLVLLDLRDGYAALALAVALSWSLDAMAGATLLYLGRWSVHVALVALLVLAAAGALLRLAQLAHRSPRQPVAHRDTAGSDRLRPLPGRRQPVWPLRWLFPQRQRLQGASASEAKGGRE
ncbi:MAG: hypothetical protein ACRDHX_14505 [Chloroflexota bacterium]